jgi:hypothetical protein
MDRAVVRDAAIGLAGAAVAAYLVARAILVPITYDEAATFVRYVDAGFTAIFDFNVATNHLLNTGLTWLSTQVFGSAPWALRLPTVIAGIGFIAAAAAIARRAESAVVAVAGFVVMVANPYALDYLALSRGYGMALCLLMAAVYFLLEWLDRPPDSVEAHRLLTRAIWLSALAVLATFTVLPAFLALMAVVVPRLLWTTSGAAPASHAEAREWGQSPGQWGQSPASDRIRGQSPASSRINLAGRAPSWRFLGGWLLLAAGFSLLVFSRQEILSASLFTPITVRTVGLFESENDDIQVYRVDAKGRLRSFERTGPAEWQADAARNAWGLRIELPVSVDRNLTSLDVATGAQVFRRDRGDEGPWTAWDQGSRRILRSTPALSLARSNIPTVKGAINWGGDGAQWQMAARHTGVLMAGLAAAAALLAGIASLAVRGGFVGAADARLLVAAIVAVAGFTAAPLYLLRRDAQLYFGGNTGLVGDTFGSLLAKTAYGVTYLPSQVPSALLGLAILVVLLLVVWALAPRHRHALSGAMMLLAVIALIALIVSAQHVILGTPWLTGRTALFLVPLISAFVVVTADGLTRLGPRARIVVSVVMMLLAAASALHLARVANVSRTLDWPDDARTPAMLAEVASRVDKAAPGTTRIGVQWMFYPAARYYAERLSTGPRTFIVEVTPADGPTPDFFYTAERLDPAEATLIGAFEGSPAALWQSVTAQPRP